MKLLGGVSVVIFLYLVSLIFKAPGSLITQGAGGKLNDMTRDPNLDGRSS